MLPIALSKPITTYNTATISPPMNWLLDPAPTIKFCSSAVSTCCSTSMLAYVCAYASREHTDVPDVPSLLRARRNRPTRQPPRSVMNSRRFRFAFGPRRAGLHDIELARAVSAHRTAIDARANVISGRDGMRATFNLVQSARHQHCKYDCNENERGHISHQMTALGRITEGLHPHDHRVNHARPYGEPDEALVSVGIS